ncbi:hypothetical protein ACFDR9_000553 [Janthinobacterium sp. CG_23.3]|uniref:hypothetical protein n=1 Tax=Janthinobacterium sp. CG_23.3 TaxID=3349634 RepID=UPI0038D44DD2
MTAPSQEVDLMAFQQAWLTRGIAGLLKQLAPAEFPPEFQTSLVNRREFVDFTGLLPAALRTYPDKPHAVELVLKHPQLSSASPRAHTSIMRALAEQPVFNSCYRSQARLLWWSATQ